MRSLVLSFSLFFVLQARAQKLDHLIYRCDELHWECVDAATFQSCRDQRIRDSKAGKRILSCAEFERLPSVRACDQRLLFLVTHNHGTRFCLGTGLREKTRFSQ